MLNIIIPARSEYPQLVWTVYSLIEDVRGHRPFHVTVVSNGAREARDKKVAWITQLLKHYNFTAPVYSAENLAENILNAVSPNSDAAKMDKWFSEGKLAKRGYLTVISKEEPQHPYAAIQEVSETLDEGLILFCCGHVAVQRGTVVKMADLAEKTNGYCHSPMLYMGDYPDASGKRKLYGYKDPIKRGWSWNRISDKPYMWSGGGGGLSCVSLETWRDVKGAEPPFRQGIGGIEHYMDMKMWMFGKSVWIHPDCLYFHWAKNRGYTWKMHEHYWNQLVGTYCLAGREAMEKENKSFNYPQPASVLDEVEAACSNHYSWIQAHKKFTLQQVVDNKPWLGSDGLK